MKRSVAAVALLSCLALPASSQIPLDFESALRQVRSSVLDLRRTQAELGTLSLSDDVKRAVDDAWNLSVSADGLRRRIEDIRRRARFPGSPPDPGWPSPSPWPNPSPWPGPSPTPPFPRPNPSPFPRDPHFEADLRQLVWSLQDFAHWAQSLGQNIAMLESRAVKDPSLVKPAKDLKDSAETLRNQTTWLASEGQGARIDLTFGNYNFEGWEIEQSATGADSSAAGALASAGRLLDKVRGNLAAEP